MSGNVYIAADLFGFLLSHLDELLAQSQTLNALIHPQGHANCLGKIVHEVEALVANYLRKDATC